MARGRAVVPCEPEGGRGVLQAGRARHGARLVHLEAVAEGAHLGARLHPAQRLLAQQARLGRRGGRAARRDLQQELRLAQHRRVLRPRARALPPRVLLSHRDAQLERLRPEAAQLGVLVGQARRRLDRRARLAAHRRRRARHHAALPQQPRRERPIRAAGEG